MLAPMRTWLTILVLTAGALCATPAAAQFQNHSLGVRVGYLTEPGALDLQGTFPIPAFGINGSFYIQDHFDFFGAMDVGIQENSLHHQALLIYPEVAVRYFFFEDYLRPYAGAELSFVHAFLNDECDGTSCSTTDNLIGAGAMLGLEYSITDQLSLGGSAELVALFWLNEPVILEPRIFVRLSTNF